MRRLADERHGANGRNCGKFHSYGTCTSRYTCPFTRPLGAARMRENADTKGARYLSEGRLRVLNVDEDDGVVMAECRGDGAIYSLGRDERGWFCGCPARGRCCHLKALGRVVVMEPRR
jgi:hypothetical protein